MSVSVRREGGRVWLEGVEGWSVGDKESSVHAAQEAVMRAVGEGITYDDLVSVSGLAFRMQVSRDGLCPSSPHPACGYPCLERSNLALPWTARVFEVKPDETEKIAEVRRAVVESIERGVPVQYGSEEDGIIIGYQRDGEEWICFHPEHDGGTKAFVEAGEPWVIWGVVVYTGSKRERPSGRELAIGALQQAVTMSQAEAPGGYYVGARAWEVYVQKLEALDGADEAVRREALAWDLYARRLGRPEGDEEAIWQLAMLGNAWIYECLAQFRGVAARYLRGVAEGFGPDAAGHLHRAADLYDRLSHQVLTDQEHGTVTVAPYAWSLREGERWTSDMRREQIRRLVAARLLEQEALGEIEKALAVIGRG